MTDFTELVKLLTAMVSLLTALSAFPRHSSRARSPKRKATVAKTMTQLH